MGTKQNPLIGKRIVKVWLADDKQAMKFDVEGAEPIIAKVDADCCSFTWIESFDAPTALLGVVQAIENLDMPDLGNGKEQTRDKDTEGDVIAYYGCKITTDKGACVIDYRNDSNGYYGGSIVWPNEGYYYGGVYGQNVSAERWKEVAHV